MNADEGEAYADAKHFRERQIYDCQRLIRYYFPMEEWDRAIWVAWHESEMHPGCHARTHRMGFGLFQLDPVAVGLTHDQAWRLYNPMVNVPAAYGLWLRQGWRPWNITNWPKSIQQEFQDKG